MMIITIRMLIVLIMGILTVSCSTQVSRKKITPPLTTTHFVPASFQEFDGWDREQHEVALAAFTKSCKVIMLKKDHWSISLFTKLGGKAKPWKESCAIALDLMEKINCQQLRGKKSIYQRRLAKQFFEKYFSPYKVGSSNHGRSLTFNGRFTGYYEIELQGTRKCNRQFPHPVYMPPSNLKNFQGNGNISRAAINRGSLAKKGLEIAWINDMPRLYFMHIQGSGVIRLREGGEIRLVWAGSNGFKNTPLSPSTYIGSTLEVMNQLRKNKRLGMFDMDKNPSYIFFKQRNTIHPLGSQGVELTPEHSVAIDRKIYPYGTPMWIQTHLPRIRGYVNKQTKYNKLFIAQDRGGAINGSIRADLFFGRGRRAEHLASGTNSIGEMYVLFPKNVKVPSTYG